MELEVIRILGLLASLLSPHSKCGTSQPGETTAGSLHSYKGGLSSYFEMALFFSLVEGLCSSSRSSLVDGLGRWNPLLEHLVSSCPW